MQTLPMSSTLNKSFYSLHFPIDTSKLFLFYILGAPQGSDKPNKHEVEINSRNNREEKCDVTKIQIFEIMGLVAIFRTNKMKKVSLP